MIYQIEQLEAPDEIKQVYYSIFNELLKNYPAARVRGKDRHSSLLEDIDPKGSKRITCGEVISYLQKNDSEILAEQKYRTFFGYCGEHNTDILERYKPRPQKEDQPSSSPGGGIRVA